MDLTTYVVDDDPDTAHSLTFLLRTASIRARSFPSAINFLENFNPEFRGCVITDVRMPGMDGVALIGALRDLGSPMPVIVITGHADVPIAVSAMKAGAVDLIEKPYESGVVLAVVRRCLASAEDTGHKQSQKLTVDRRVQSLTARERQVFAAVAEGQSNKEVAQALKISPRTVEIHRSNVMSKMRAESLSDLVRMMLTAGPA